MANGPVIPRSLPSREGGQFYLTTRTENMNLEIKVLLWKKREMDAVQIKTADASTVKYTDVQ